MSLDMALDAFIDAEMKDQIYTKMYLMIGMEADDGIDGGGGDAEPANSTSTTQDPGKKKLGAQIKEKAQAAWKMIIALAKRIGKAIAKFGTFVKDSLTGLANKAGFGTRDGEATQEEAELIDKSAKILEDASKLSGEFIKNATQIEQLVNIITNDASSEQQVSEAIGKLDQFLNWSGENLDGLKQRIQEVKSMHSSSNTGTGGATEADAGEKKVRTKPIRCNFSLLSIIKKFTGPGTAIANRFPNLTQKIDNFASRKQSNPNPETANVDNQRRIGLAKAMKAINTVTSFFQALGAAGSVFGKACSETVRRKREGGMNGVGGDMKKAYNSTMEKNREKNQNANSGENKPNDGKADQQTQKKIDKITSGG